MRGTKEQFLFEMWASAVVVLLVGQLVVIGYYTFR